MVKMLRKIHQKLVLFYIFDYSVHRPLERTIEFIFGLPEKSIGPLDGNVNSSFIPAIIKNQFSKIHCELDASVTQREGISLAPSGVARNSVLVSLFSIILHFLSEGFEMMKSNEAVCQNVGFLHRGGQQKFPLSLFLKNDPHRADITRLGGLFSHISKSYPTDDQEEEIIQWEEGCMDDEQNIVTHTTEQKPCCWLAYDTDLTKSLKDRGKNTAKSSRGQCSSIPERSLMLLQNLMLEVSGK